MAENMAEVGTDIPDEEPVDRREALEEAFNSLEETGEVAALAERPRAPDGKFAKAEETPAPVASQPAVPTATEPSTEPMWKRPPASWKKEYHDAWTAADPRLQEYAFQREEQMRKGVEPLISKAQFADSIQKVVEPYMPTIRGMGIDVPTAVRGLMEADHILRSSPPDQKAAYFARLAAQYGVQLGDIPAGQQSAPDVANVQNEILRLRGEMQAWKEQEQARENEKLLREIEQFAHNAPHFETVRPQMTQLLQSGLAETLQDAYDKAIRLHDDLFKSSLAAQQAKEEAERKANANRAVSKARSAAVSVKSSTPGVTSPTKAQDRRSVLSEQFDALSERL